MNIITLAEAKALGYRPLTSVYRLQTERKMLAAVLADMSAGGIETVLVEVPHGVEVWRLGGVGLDDEV